MLSHDQAFICLLIFIPFAVDSFFARLDLWVDYLEGLFPGAAAAFLEEAEDDIDAQDFAHVAAENGS